MAENLRILYVDDQAGAPNLVSRFEMLTDRGFEIVPVDKLSSAAQVLRDQRGRLDAVVVDLIMPFFGLYTAEETRGGLETGLRLFRDLQKEAPDLPFVVISIREEEDIREALEELGVKDFLPKHSDISEYEDVLKRAIGRRK